MGVGDRRSRRRGLTAVRTDAAILPAPVVERSIMSQVALTGWLAGSRTT